MENSFNQKEFERFLKSNADQYRMFPSEKVWQGIHHTLHTKRKWYGIGLISLILITGVATWVMLATSVKTEELARLSPRQNSRPQPPILTEPEKNNSNPLPETVLPAFSETTHLIRTENSPVSFTQSKPVFESSLDWVPAIPVSVNSSEKAQPVNPGEFFNSDHSSLSIQKFFEKTIPSSLVTKFTRSTKSLEPGIAVTEKIREHENSTESQTPAEINEKNPPLTIESVVNFFEKVRLPRKISWEAYMTPTVSYRELQENKPFINWARNQASGSNNFTFTPDIDNVVTHKPDIGLQFGVRAGIPVGNRFKLIGGLQFNVSKYDIKASNYPTEIATISLSNAVGVMNNVSAVSSYRNVGGPKANWLHNLYFSVSAPIGLEMKITGNRRNYFGVSATAQPTYVIGNNSYLLSTDYKNYAQIPSLSRKWNMNAGFEVFAGINTGNLKWRVGPQVRYQVMSSYKEKYPIKEHLFDFGLKMGIMLNK